MTWFGSRVPMPAYDLSSKRVFVAGHEGMVGSAIMRRLQQENCILLTARHAVLDLRDQSAVRAWMRQHRPDAVFLAAAKVGGILANSTYPADFLYDNLAIQTNVMAASMEGGVEKLLFLGSSCIYPKYAPQPIPEGALLGGPLEPTNEWYAIAKIAGLKLCEAYRRQHGADFISAMPTNLCGPGDTFDLANSHVIPALIQKAHEAKMAGRDVLPIWGTGKARREFLHVDDAADALVFLMKQYSDAEHINIGCGEDISVLQLARLVCDAVGLDARIEIDASRPDGTPRKLLDVARLFGLGWRPRHTLREGIVHAYRQFLTGIARGGTFAPPRAEANGQRLPQ